MFANQMWLFPFLPPLEVRVLAHNLGTNELLFEVHVQNIALSDSTVEKITLVFPETCIETETNTFNVTAEDGDDTFEEITLLKPMDRHRYFCQIPIKQDILERPDGIWKLTEQAILDIQWKGGVGDMTLEQKLQLDKEVLRYGTISVSVESMPDIVFLEEPFHMTCKVTNFTNKKMKLFLKLCHTYNIRWHLAGGKYLGMLSPRKSLSFTVNLLFIKYGLQRVSGIQITDKISNKTYCCENIVTVRVEPTLEQMDTADFSIRIRQKTSAF
ncbi:trafficking protein particle complex subunit 13-like [Ochotona princeps]|uniref:trafficking protein particle complex subunit 13-like n=1 Tax=Ochotona princeps TaxID=9978 RepID=UPI0027147778|nr:trafficking protein particle complex subunit 13-like [Ochotona princeps]